MYVLYCFPVKTLTTHAYTHTLLSPWKQRVGMLSCVLTLGNPTNFSPQALLSMEFFQARILDLVASSYSSGSSWPRDQTQVSCISHTGRQILYYCVTWEAPWEQRLHCFIQYCTPCLYYSVWHIVAIQKISVKWISKWKKNYCIL